MKIIDRSASFAAAAAGSENKFNAAALAIVDDLERTSHLVHASILACDSMEDLETRNAFVALLGEIAGRVKASADVVRSQILQ